VRLGSLSNVAKNKHENEDDNTTNRFLDQMSVGDDISQIEPV